MSNHIFNTTKYYFKFDNQFVLKHVAILKVETLEVGIHERDYRSNHRW